MPKIDPDSIELGPDIQDRLASGGFKPLVAAAPKPALHSLKWHKQEEIGYRMLGQVSDLSDVMGDIHPVLAWIFGLAIVALDNAAAVRDPARRRRIAVREVAAQVGVEELPTAFGTVIELAVCAALPCFMDVQERKELDHPVGEALALEG